MALLVKTNASDFSFNAALELGWEKIAQKYLTEVKKR